MFNGFDRKNEQHSQKKMGNISRWIMEILQKNQKIMLEKKN